MNTIRAVKYIRLHSVSLLAIAGLFSAFFQLLSRLLLSLLTALTLLLFIFVISGIVLSAAVWLLARLLVSLEIVGSIPQLIADISSLFLHDWRRPLLFGLMSMLLLTALAAAGRISKARNGLMKLLACFTAFTLVTAALGSGIGSSSLHLLGNGTLNWLINKLLQVAIVPVLIIVAVTTFFSPFQWFLTAIQSHPLYKGMVIGEQNVMPLLTFLPIIGAFTAIFYVLIGEAAIIVTGSICSSLFRRMLAANIRLRTISVSRLAVVQWPRLNRWVWIFQPTISFWAIGLAVCLISGSYAYLVFISDIIASLARAIRLVEGVDVSYSSVRWAILVTTMLPWIAFTTVCIFKINLMRAQAVEIILVMLIAAIYIFAVSDDNVARHVFPIIFALPAINSFLFLRGLVWKGLHRSRERYRSIRQRHIDDATALPAIHPILYLRAFTDDYLALRRSVDLLDLLMGSPSPRRRFEELIAERASHWRPIVALGNPHIPFQMHGVLKLMIGDSDWKAEVRYWFQHSAYLLMIANRTTNIGWEVDLIRSSGRQHSAIFVVTSAPRAVEFFTAYGILPDDLQAPPKSLIVYYDEEHGWTAIGSLLRTATAYRAALDIAMSRVEPRYRTATSKLLTE